MPSDDDQMCEQDQEQWERHKDQCCAANAALRSRVEQLERERDEAYEELAREKCADCDGGWVSNGPVCCSEPDCGCQGRPLPGDGRWCDCRLGWKARSERLAAALGDLLSARTHDI